jgi:hypothetical protein
MVRKVAGVFLMSDNVNLIRVKFFAPLRHCEELIHISKDNLVYNVFVAFKDKKNTRNGLANQLIR